MKLAAKWYRRLTRFNAIAFAIVLVLAFVSLALSIYSNFGYSDYSPRHETFGQASVGQMPLSGEKIPVRGAAFVKYYVVDDIGSYDWAKRTNVTIVDTRSGKSHKILSDRDPRKLINWELIYRDDDEREAFGYLAWAATKEMEANGRADLLIAGLPDLKQFVLAKNAKFADAPQVYGDNGIATIVWREEDKAEFVAFDLGKGEVVQSTAVDLPVIPRNLLNTSSGPMGDRARQVAGDVAAPAIYH